MILGSTDIAPLVFIFLVMRPLAMLSFSAAIAGEEELAWRQRTFIVAHTNILHLSFKLFSFLLFNFFHLVGRGARVLRRAVPLLHHGQLVNLRDQVSCKLRD